MSVERYVVAVLTVSAVAFIGIVGSESYVGQAMIPTKGDRPTVGYGSTFYEDGSPVKMGDKVDPVRALVIAQAHISREETNFRASLKGASLTQAEFDTYMDFVYQYGSGTWLNSSMRRNVLKQDYKAACDSLLLYKMMAGYDCSIPGNKVCAGVWTRQLERHKKCLGPVNEGQSVASLNQSRGN